MNRALRRLSIQLRQGGRKPVCRLHHINESDDQAGIYAVLTQEAHITVASVA